MGNFQHQPSLFNTFADSKGDFDSSKQMQISKKNLEDWQSKVYSYQEKLFKVDNGIIKQGSLFEKAEESQINFLKPLDLTPLPLNFWRWPKAPHEGPAIYMVMDRPKNFYFPILLYIGETIAADKRWKGEHDCKEYLASYCEALSNAEIKMLLSIRFWADVPENTKERRNLEQKLIRYWLPPFNKETRDRWNTPFTSYLKK